MAPKLEFHPLFLPDENSPEDFAPGAIAYIWISRWEKGGKIRVPQRFKPEQLRDLTDITSRFGGGDYELEARVAEGQIYAKRQYSLPGVPKALAPDEAETSAAMVPSSSPAAAPSSMDPMIAIVLEMGRQNQALMLGMFNSIASVAAAVLARPVPAPPAPPPSSSPAEMMSAVASLVGATRPPAPPPPTPMSEVLGIMNAVDKAAEQRTEAARAAAKDLEPGESTADVVKAVSEAAMPLIAAAAGGKAPT